jgi:hypothetical protein
MRKVLLALCVVAVCAGIAAAIELPLGFDYRASVVDRSNLFTAGVPQPYGAVPLVGDENRSVFSVDAVNFGLRAADIFGVPMIVDVNPQAPVTRYANGELSGMLYDINVLASSSIPGANPPWTLYFGPGSRYTSTGGTDGTWTDTVIGDVVATTGGGYGGLLIVYQDPTVETNFALGPGAWQEGTLVNPDPSLTASDNYPTISDAAPWLVAVLAPMTTGGIYPVPPGTVSVETLNPFPASNSGFALANIIGGTAAGIFQLDTFGPGWDIRLEFEPIIGQTAIDGWQTASDDPVQFSTIPEPMTLSLLGLGLAGLVARRRRQR